MDPVSRRRFLWSSLAVATTGAVLLEACGGDDANADGVAVTDQPKLPLSVLIANADLTVGTNRMAVAVVEQATGTRYTAPSVELGFTPPIGAGTKIPLASNFAAAPYHGDGLDTPSKTGPGTDVHGVFVTTAQFDRPGTDRDPWWIWVRVGDRLGVSPVAVNQTGQVVGVGAAAPASPSPTTTATMGVDPICTRSPACGLHTVSLSDVIGKQPVVVSFSTPARCTSQLCGPTLDLLVEQVPNYQSRVAFVHVEIYQNNATTDVIQTVRDWNLPSEPWLFGIGADGKIVARLDSAFDRPEVTSLIEAAAATA